MAAAARRVKPSPPHALAVVLHAFKTGAFKTGVVLHRFKTGPLEHASCGEADVVDARRQLGCLVYRAGSRQLPALRRGGELILLPRLKVAARARAGRGRAGDQVEEDRNHCSEKAICGQRNLLQRPSVNHCSENDEADPWPSIC